MSNTIPETLTIDDLNYFWSAEGLPVFYADRDDICDIVESMGFNIYYLLGQYEKKVNPPSKNNTSPSKNNTKNSTTPPAPPPIYTYETQWFKVVNNFVGRSVSKSSPSLPDNFVSIDESAHYNMPLIPHVIVDKLDQFFRLVDSQHGTESIVMLTYDTNKQGSEGWGILVPDQENTSANCSYDPHSIAEMKPDNVMIVGSVHSHPNMAAYASGTDHADQADFDGVHITYGWQKSVNNGSTQYHIELQMSGNTYSLRPEDVFENYFIDKQPDPDVVEWSSKVKKELPLPIKVGDSTQVSSPTQQHLLQAPISLGTGLPKNFSYKDLPWVEYLSNIYTTCDVPENTILVAEIDTQSDKHQYCPSCDCFIDHYSVFDGFCDTCYIPICYKGTPRIEILELALMYAQDLNLNFNVPVYLVGYDYEDSVNEIFVMPISETDLFKDLNGSFYSKNNSYSKLNDDSYLLCCGISEDDIKTCFCTPRITQDHFLEYENIIKDQDIYVDKHVNCIGCEHYYSPVCNQMRDLLVDWISSPQKHLESIANNTVAKIDGASCPQFQYYISDLKDEYIYGT